MRQQQKMTKPSPRRGLLESQDLLHAPQEVQEAFWHRHNRDKRLFRRAPLPLGDLTSRLLTEGAGRSADRLAEVGRAWFRVVPPAHRPRTKVNSFRGGCLQVLVDGTLKFVYGRGMRGDLLAALNAELGGIRISRIEYRVGSVHQ